MFLCPIGNNDDNSLLFLKIILLFVLLAGEGIVTLVRKDDEFILTIEFLTQIK